MAKSIFYAWESDIDPALNRHLIYDCVKRAVKKLNREHLSDLIVDRDTKNVPGMPDIGDTILEKIEKSAVVVADLSIINPAAVRRPEERPVSNPNVLFELGFSFGKLGPTAIVGVINTAFGTPEDLPFDLRPKRLMPYQLASTDDKGEVRANLVDELAKAIKGCLGETEATQIDRNTQIVRSLRDIRMLSTEIGEWRGLEPLQEFIQALLAAAKKLPELMKKHGVDQGMLNLTSQIIFKMNLAATLSCNDENWPAIEAAISSAGLLARFARDRFGFTLDVRSHKESVESLIQVPAELDKQIQNIQNGQLHRRDLERLSIDLRTIAFLPLIPEHPQFVTGLDEISLDFRRLFLRWAKSHPKQGEAITALSDIRDRLSLLLAKYPSL